MLKESNRVGSTASVRNSVLIISHINLSGLSHAHFSDNLSRISCVYMLWFNFILGLNLIFFCFEVF